jgi:hypothetical protein
MSTSSPSRCSPTTSLLDDPHEATDAIIDAFIEIRTAAVLSGELTPVGDTLPLAAATG